MTTHGCCRALHLGRRRTTSIAQHSVKTVDRGLKPISRACRTTTRANNYPGSGDRTHVPCAQPDGDANTPQRRSRHSATRLHLPLSQLRSSTDRHQARRTPGQTSEAYPLPAASASSSSPGPSSRRPTPVAGCGGSPTAPHWAGPGLFWLERRSADHHFGTGGTAPARGFFARLSGSIQVPETR